VDRFTVLAVNPFANFEPLLVSTNVHSSCFFVTWFRARTRIRWVALVRSVGLITID